MMEKFQEYIVQNLPDRFKSMKVFRIPVRCDGVCYWAIYNNGTWKFEPGSTSATPVVDYMSEMSSTPSIQEEEIDLDIPAAYNTPAKGKKEKPVKEKKERPVREKKEKPVKEKKERPIKQEKVIEDGVEDMDAEFISSQCTFNKDCLNKKMCKLTGRIAMAILTIFVGNIVCGIADIITASKANKCIGNPIDYWHYRKVNSIWHFATVCYFIMIVLCFVLYLTGALVINSLIIGSMM